MGVLLNIYKRDSEPRKNERPWAALVCHAPQAEEGFCVRKQRHAMQTYGREDVRLYAFLISVLDRGEWSATRRRRYAPLYGAPLHIEKETG
jgi:hypothetical protein